MTVGELKELIRTVANDVQVVVPIGDHDYGSAYAAVTTGLQGDHRWTEDYGEDVTPESEHGKRVPVVVVGV